MTALIQSLEAAEGGSRELDKELAETFGLVRRGGWFSDGIFYAPCIRGDGNTCPPLPRLTTSLDAALALAERVMPSSPEPADVPWDQWCIELTMSPVWRREQRLTWDCTIGNGLGFGGAVALSASTPALALCIAILRAKEGDNHAR